MSRRQKSFLLVGGLGLLTSVSSSWHLWRELQSARRESLVVIRANDFLKKRLGDMAVALTAKDREIDRLQRSACDGRDKAQPFVSTTPDRGNISGIRAQRLGPGRQSHLSQEVDHPGSLSW